MEVNRKNYFGKSKLDSRSSLKNLSTLCVDAHVLSPSRCRPDVCLQGGQVWVCESIKMTCKANDLKAHTWNGNETGKEKSEQ